MLAKWMSRDSIHCVRRARSAVASVHATLQIGRDQEAGRETRSIGSASVNGQNQDLDQDQDPKDAEAGASLLHHPGNTSHCV